MRILHFTDLHLRGPRQTPRWRTGSLVDDLIDKLEAVAGMYEKAEPDLVTFGGDFVDSFSTSIQSVNLAIDAMDWLGRTELYCAWGQHDLLGHSPTTWVGSSASVLARCATTTERNWGEYYVGGIGDEEYTIGIVNHHHGVHEALTDGSLGNLEAQVVVVHAMIVPESVPWEHVLISDLQTDARVVLTGDYHPGFQPVQFTNTKGEEAWVVNPGAMARQAINDRDRVPQVSIVDITEDSIAIEYLPIPCRPAEEAFRVEEFLQLQEEQAEHGKFADMLGEVTKDGVASWEKLFERMQADPDWNWKEEIIKEAYERCQTAANR